jgi:hypothetical protein
MLSLLSGILQLVAFFPYGRSIIKGETKPSKASWLIWAILDTITFAGMYAADALNGQIIATVIGVWVIVILAFVYGESGWKKFDLACLAGGVFGIVLWVLFANPTFGIVISVTVTLIGAVPTFRNTYYRPDLEDRLSWILYWFAAASATLAIPSWDLDHASQPVVFLVIESVILWLLYRR